MREGRWACSRKDSRAAPRGADWTGRPRFADTSLVEPRPRTSFRLIALAIVAACLIAGVFVASRISSARACDEWRRALDELTASAEGMLGVETAQQFRREAILRGWVDSGGVRVSRPPDCTP